MGATKELNERVARLEVIAEANRECIAVLDGKLDALIDWQTRLSGQLSIWRWLAPIGTALAIGLLSRWIGI